MSMPNENQVRTFEILASRRESFERRMAQLARKAAKLGCTAPTYQMGEAVIVDRSIVREDGSKYNYKVEVYPTTVTAEIVKFAGWTFVATLEHLVEGETLLRSAADVELPVAYRTAGPVCDHCKLDRKRRDTYVVRHDQTGEFKQIGHSCIADFLGHKSPEQLAAMAEFIADSMGWDDYCSGGHIEEIADTLGFMTVVTTLVRLRGYASRKVVEERGGGLTTAAQAFQVLFPSKAPKQQADSKEVLAAVTDADREKAQLAIDWILNLEGDLNDFLHNVRAVVRAGGIKNRTKGYAAALSVAYARAMDEIRERAEHPVSKHVGAVGERLIFTATVHKIIALESEWGVTQLHIMTDSEGNDLKWFGSGGIAEEGETVTFKGTVKKHDEYKGRAQTILSRCALYTPPVKKPRAKKPRAKKAKAAPAAEPKSDDPEEAMLMRNARDRGEFYKGDGI